MAVEVAPEFESLPEFIKEKLDNDDYSFDHTELCELAAGTRRSHRALRQELVDFGFTFKERAKERVINQRTSPFAGMHGGSGASNIFGMAGKAASPGGGV